MRPRPAYPPTPSPPPHCAHARLAGWLQADIEECDRNGGGNRDISPDERIDDWVACLAAVGSKEDVDLLVVPLLGAAA